MGTEMELLARLFDAFDGLSRELEGIQQEMKGIANEAKLLENAMIRQGISQEKIAG